jgi:hypothetical protein
MRGIALIYAVVLVTEVGGPGRTIEWRDHPTRRHHQAQDWFAQGKRIGHARGSYSEHNTQG